MKRAPLLKATTAAAGLSAALTQVLPAASLSTNLVVNGDFETLGPGTGPYGSREVGTGWAGPTSQTLFAYNYSTNYDDRDALGSVPPGNGSWFWTMNGNADVAAVQSIDLSTGASASVISLGIAGYDVSAYFTNYAADPEGGRLRLEFLDSSNALIGTAITFDDPNLDEWTQVGGTGTIPVGTETAVLTLERNPSSGLSGGPDVYADNVSFIVVPEPSSMLLVGLGGLIGLRRRRQ